MLIRKYNVSFGRFIEMHYLCNENRSQIEMNRRNTKH